MHVSPSKSYHARTVGQSIVHIEDNQSIFKIYYISIIGRDDPTLYEWEHNSLSPHRFEAELIKSQTEGIGFIIAFPHIAKIFRFAPAMETVLHVLAFNPADMKLLDLSGENGFTEFACYAETIIAADEYRAWAKASTVEEYFSFQSAFADRPIKNHSKLAEYVEDLKTSPFKVVTH